MIAEIEIGAVIDGTVERITPLRRVPEAGGRQARTGSYLRDRPQLREGRARPPARAGRGPGESPGHQGRRQDRSLDQGPPGSSARAASSPRFPDPGLEQMLKKFMKQEPENPWSITSGPSSTSASSVHSWRLRAAGPPSEAPYVSSTHRSPLNVVCVRATASVKPQSLHDPDRRDVAFVRRLR